MTGLLAFVMILPVLKHCHYTIISEAPSAERHWLNSWIEATMKIVVPFARNRITSEETVRSHGTGWRPQNGPFLMERTTGP